MFKQTRIGDIELIEPNPELIVDQNELVIKINGKLLDVLCKPLAIYPNKE